MNDGYEAIETALPHRNQALSIKAFTNFWGKKQRDFKAFWIKVQPEYPKTTTKTLKTELPFPTSYLGEAGFSGFLPEQQLKLDYGVFWTHFECHCHPSLLETSPGVPLTP